MSRDVTAGGCMLRCRGGKKIERSVLHLYILTYGLNTVPRVVRSAEAVVALRVRRAHAALPCISGPDLGPGFPSIAFRTPN